MVELGCDYCVLCLAMHDSLEQRLAKAQPRAEEAEVKRKSSKEMRAYDSSKRADQAEADVLAACRRAEFAELRANISESKAEQAEARAEQAKQEKDQAMLERDQAKREKNRAKQERYQVEQERDQATERATVAEQRAYLSQQQATHAERRARDAETRSRDIEQRALERVRAAEERALVAERRALADQQFWVVRREEIEFTQEKELGRGGWAVVKVAKFRGLRVAAKCLHNVIISDYNR